MGGGGKLAHSQGLGIDESRPVNPSESVSGSANKHMVTATNALQDPWLANHVGPPSTSNLMPIHALNQSALRLTPSHPDLGQSNGTTFMQPVNRPDNALRQDGDTWGRDDELLAQMEEREDRERGDDALNYETFGIGYGPSIQAPLLVTSAERRHVAPHLAGWGDRCPDSLDNVPTDAGSSSHSTLPPSWTQHYDKTHRKAYYYSALTGTSTWYHP